MMKMYVCMDVIFLKYVFLYIQSISSNNTHADTALSYFLTPGISRIALQFSYILFIKPLGNLGGSQRQRRLMGC